MDNILQGILHVFCYIDDILVMAESQAHHLQNLEEVLKRLEEHGVHLKREKCQFFSRVVSGIYLDGDGVHTSEKKVQAIQKAPTLKDVHELRSYLGMTNYYAKFIPNLATLLHPK